jgi:hypothetical protein
MAVTQNKAVTPQGLISGQAVCVAAKATYNDNVNAVKLLTAGPNGMLLFSLRALPRMTVTACQLQAYRSPDGVVMNLFDMALMAAYTMAANTSTPKTDFGYAEGAPLRLAANEQIWVGIGVAFATGIAFDATGENL